MEPRTQRHTIGQHKKLKGGATQTQPKMPRVNEGACEGYNFLLLIRHPPCYSYIQSSPVKILTVIEERNIYVKSKRSIVI